MDQRGSLTGLDGVCDRLRRSERLLSELDLRLSKLEDGAAARPLAALPSSLTRSERRIAALAAAGWKNHEVAARLALSPKTVEWNLTKVYRKLAVRSRTELAARLRVVDNRGTNDNGADFAVTATPTPGWTNQ